MNIQISNMTTVKNASQETLREIRDRLTFLNPAFLENERRGFSNWKTDRQIQCFFPERSGGLSCPRGFTRQIVQIGKNHQEAIHLDDRRRVLPDVDFKFTRTLKPFQKMAIDSTILKPFGVLQAPTGSGKTVMALAIIARRKQPVLIIVHTKELLIQWIDRIESFLCIPKKEIGVIGNGKMRINRITVGLVQTLCKYADDVFEHIGFLIVDECHRCPSKTFLDVVTRFDCKYMLGLSATPYRRDGLTRLIHFHLGGKVHEVSGGMLVDDGHICKAEVETIETAFRTEIDGSTEYPRLLSKLTEDSERNRLIVSCTAREAEGTGGVVLVLSDRKKHCEVLRAALSANYGLSADVLTGGVSNGNRVAIVERLRSGKVRILVATGQLIGEGFDMPGIASVILATPLKFSGRLIQYIGRALRPAPGKDHARVIDFVDSRVGVLAAGAKSRARTFRTMPGITLKG